MTRDPQSPPGSERKHAVKCAASCGEFPALDFPGTEAPDVGGACRPGAAATEQELRGEKLRPTAGGLGAMRRLTDNLMYNLKVEATIRNYQWRWWPDRTIKTFPLCGIILCCRTQPLTPPQL